MVQELVSHSKSNLETSLPSSNLESYPNLAGLATTWMLNDYGIDDEVHLFESDSRAGGHANTVNYTKPGGLESDSVKVDT